MATKFVRSFVLSKVYEIISLRTKGADRENIHRYAKEKDWKLSSKQIDRYIRKAKDIELEMAQEDAKTQRARAINMKLATVRQAEVLFKNAKTSNEKTYALSVLNDLQKDYFKLLNLYTEQIRILDPDTNRKEIEEARKLLKAEDADFEEIKGGSEYGT